MAYMLARAISQVLTPPPPSHSNLHPLIVPIAHTTIANMASIAPITTTTTTNSSLTINLGTTAMRSRRLAGLQHTVLYHSRA